MPRVTLRPQTLRTLKPGPTGRRVGYYDKKQPGLLLRVGGTSPRDRVWYFEYSIANRSRRMRLGDLTDDVGLSDRREDVKRLRGLVSSGVDPLTEREKRREEKRKADARETFGALGERALASLEKTLRPKTTAEWRRIWAKTIRPAMGDVDASDAVAVRRAALKMSDGLAGEGKLFGANRCLELARRVMSFGVATDRDGVYAANPLFRIPKPLREETPRTRVYSAAEVRRVVAAAEGTLYEDLVPLLLATGARAGETLAAEWSEFDLDSRTWNIPGSKSKIKHDRPVPLNRYALGVLRGVREKADGLLLFPAPTRSGHMERMSKVIYGIRKESGVDDFALHDLRRVVRAGLADLSVATDVAELSLGHLPRSSCERTRPTRHSGSCVISGPRWSRGARSCSGCCPGRSAPGRCCR